MTSSNTVEVNGGDGSDALTFHEILSDLSYDGEIPVTDPVLNDSTVLDESVQTQVSFTVDESVSVVTTKCEIINGNVAIEGSELQGSDPNPVSVFGSDVVVNETVRMPVSFTVEESIVTTTCEFKNGNDESVQTQARFTIDESVVTTTRVFTNGSVTSELTTLQKSSDQNRVPVLSSSVVDDESVQMPASFTSDESIVIKKCESINGSVPIEGSAVLTSLPNSQDPNQVPILSPSVVDDESIVIKKCEFTNGSEPIEGSAELTSIAELQETNQVPYLSSSVVGDESVKTQARFTIDESFVLKKCEFTNGSEHIEGSELTSLAESPQLHAATSDNQQSPECKSLPVSSPVRSNGGNVNTLERIKQNGFRRSPRLSSSPQTEGQALSRKLKRKAATDEQKVKRSKLSVERGDGSCDNVALTGSCRKKQSKGKGVSVFVGEPVPEDEAQQRWGWRYELKGKRRKGQSSILNAGEEDEVHVNVACHYLQANVNGCIFSLGDCAHIKGEGKQPHVGRIVEFFKTTDDEKYFRVQWFYRAEDTVMKDSAAFHDKKRLFYSTLMNDNLLKCIESKVKVIEKAPMLGFESPPIQQSEYYCDMEYSVKYSTFRSLVTATDALVERCDLTTSSNLATKTMTTTTTTTPLDIRSCEMYQNELTLLDLYAGCGGMSTGLCLGAKLSGVKVVTRWAIDYQKSACDSLKLNHPETEVRHITAEDFLELLKEWEKLCEVYLLDDPDRKIETSCGGENESSINDSETSLMDTDVAPGEYEVASLVDICYGDPSETGEHGLKFKVRWKGYGPSDDTWEPIGALSDCQGHLQNFVRSGYKSKILPCRGDVDVICGGPPCQGISGYNRFRNTDDPLNDERNQQIIVFFDIVKFLNPKYVLMENVTDILRFDKASLGRYALSRLVHMNYQARLGIMAAGSYGLPQFRLRVFLWGAHLNERLPQFPLPTHEVIVRYYPPPEFEQNIVAYDEGQPRKLHEAIVLRDAISDLPAITSHEVREEMTYDMPPETEFQKYIRLTKDEFSGSALNGVTDWKSSVLTDHRTYKLSEDDLHRVCYVPRKKGANFRDFPGVIVNADNTVSRGPAEEQVLLPSGRPLIPDYALTYEKGKSKRPFARVWWDENVATVLTFPNLHSQAAIHPEQDRVLTLREYARLQGFPDHYRFCGTIKERYCQVGNAVAVSVSKTLGYSLGMAFRKLSEDEALMTLPPNFAFQVPPLDDFSTGL